MSWGIAAFCAASLWSSLHAQCLNAIGRVHGAARLALLQAGINLPLVIVTVTYFGPEWLGWASAGAAMMSSVPGLSLLWHRRHQ